MFPRMMEENMKRILAFGDSNTWGFDPATWGLSTMTLERYPEDIRWTGLLQKALGNSALVIEEGLCGRTTAYDVEVRAGMNGSVVLPNILKANEPLDAAIIMLGTNDCKSIFKASSAEITEGLELCLNKILAYVSPENILIISPLYLEAAAFDYSFDSMSLAVSKELKQTYQALADTYGTAFLAASDVAKASGIDGQHLTEEGHRALYEAVLKVITSMSGMTETS